MELPKELFSNLRATFDEKSFNDALKRISTGKAMLFTGAGFSFGAKNIKGQEPPRAADLALQISNLGGFSEDEDLRFAADYYLSFGSKESLIKLLKENYTLISTTASHETISSSQWRRIYTTNYDNSIELSANKKGIIIEQITTKDSPEKYYKKNNICVHINGSITSISEESIESDFKLSTSSYIAPDSFTTSAWYYSFKKDLERSSAIVFVGYSLYDIEIQKILFGYPEFKSKTFFVIATNPSQKEVFSLSKFGTVFPIGIDFFAEKLAGAIEKYKPSKEEQTLQSFLKYENNSSENDFTDSEIIRFLLNGEIENERINNAITGIQKLPYLIIRENISRATKLISDKKNIVIFSELGNGKTIFLKELASYLSLNGHNIYSLEDSEGDYIDDLEKISSLDVNTILIIDGYEKYLDFIGYFGNLNPNKIRLILSSRTASHEHLRSTLSNIFNFREINIDLLSENEVLDFIKIIDNIGWWGDLARLSSTLKTRKIQDDYKNQISLTLLSLFNAPQIKIRISSLIETIFKDDALKNIAFAICILEILDLPLKPSLISEISFSDDIYSPKLRENKQFCQLFSIKDGEIKSKSSIFSTMLLRDYFSPSFIISKLLDIVEKYEKLNKNSHIEGQLFKSLLRFSFVERMLSDKNKKNNLERYYQDLKIRVQWLKNEPHYWLQYAMSKITFKEYENAQAMLLQAYSLAKNKSNYDISNIDTQQARIFLLRSIEETNPTESANLFINAHKLLKPLANDVYKFRQVTLYDEVYKAKYPEFSKKNQVNFEHACKNMKESLDDAELHGFINVTEQKVISLAMEKLTVIIKLIQDSRNS
ncbi:SIR2-like domain-containing protein [Methylomagnum ishizawai]|uniref:SIR2-like domain-containing protein n=1 Tax=Methylomagnum ishizawai TaxID=1760988 RepID=A0A1Y6CZC2_9GAMM|nr:SIR2 family protein [Methylomagnum ishizawai]SMF95691.1 SIR2-like domain-containing protein [Methylomagnum ishizawai]